MLIRKKRTRRYERENAREADKREDGKGDDKERTKGVIIEGMKRIVVR